MTRYLTMFLLVVVILSGAWYAYRRFFDRVSQGVVGHQVYTLELADTDEKRRLGLGERDHLCERCAMLFVFGQPGRYAFWMKGMRFPLDIAWLEDEKVVWIERRVSQESALTYQPDVVANRVMEFNAGALDGVSIGEPIKISLQQ